jgi:hypothetical protein
MQSDTLIQSLTEQTKDIITKVEQLKELDTPTLMWRENPTSWNVLESLEHLNLYGDFYYPKWSARFAILIRKAKKNSSRDF